jgi:hypothetical protein
MNFCGRCGTKLSLRWPRCAFENPPGFAFCGKCGAGPAEPTPSARPFARTGTTPRLQTPIQLGTAIELCRAMDMTFWLPDTEAVPAQIQGDAARS